MHTNDWHYQLQWLILFSLGSRTGELKGFGHQVLSCNRGGGENERNTDAERIAVNGHKIWRNSQRGHERDKEGDPGPLRQISNPSLHPMKMKYCSYFLVSIPPAIQISIYQTLIYDHLHKKKKLVVDGWLAGFCSGAK
ncbi:hypothetical protein NC653_006717 [Populus alba x Populus x berolinensis]|uniref:Uncharacterized protein n=1 Tax=Populus alba x Populus x berolinensis TaxID=444605 RepID=A0AAD6RFF7_9ROSI|nr:hypothetical protein NC653_006717 [Populus alba x Populus x berolinensis]